ncbi:DUF3742 family protein [Serratia fonticola]|uniref:DUF3742 family protein n=1 Tax=Serratia fonticola TaxID=47917 RepID=UPI0013780102|nr:DUF3742 family protein [Serratia fonticola]NCG54052.1 DUF3742 family protein [Serratia fonticola]
MAKNTSQTSSLAERRGQSLARMYLRTKSQHGRFTAWVVSKGWPAWTSKLPLVTALTLFVILDANAAFGTRFLVLGYAALAVLLIGGPVLYAMKASPSSSEDSEKDSSLFTNVSSQNDCSSSYHGPKDGYYFNNGNYYKNGYFED